MTDDLQDRIMRVVLTEFYGPVDTEDWCNNWMVEHATEVAQKVLAVL